MLKKSMVAQRSPDVIIGKQGLSGGLVEELKRRLKDREVIKVRLLRTAEKAENADRREIARRAAEATGSTLLEVRGRTFILYRPGRKAIKRPGDSPERTSRS